VKRLIFSVVAGAALWSSLSVNAQPKPDPNAFEVLKVQGNVYVFASDRGNVVAQVGNFRDNDGVLLVNTGSKEMGPMVLAELNKLTRKQLKYIVNTSADLDAIGGNETMAKPGVVRETGGPQAAAVQIYAYDPVVQRMSAEKVKLPEEAWPTMTFELLKDFTFNGEAVQLFPEGPAHTDGDSIVFFRGSNVIATGEIFGTVGYPVIDLARGGSIQGEIRALNHIIELAVPEITQEGGTMIVPAHGHICDESEVVEYRDMLTIIRDRVADYIKQGKTVEQTVAAKLTTDYDGRYSKPGNTGDHFIETVYKSLKANPESTSRSSR
jgi:glyoxylase-like metal-dependent hydrolase (beta-lactamase superfamily II)